MWNGPSVIRRQATAGTSYMTLMTSGAAPFKCSHIGASISRAGASDAEVDCALYRVAFNDDGVMHARRSARARQTVVVDNTLYEPVTWELDRVVDVNPRDAMWAVGFVALDNDMDLPAVGYYHPVTASWTVDEELPKEWGYADGIPAATSAPLFFIGAALLPVTATRLNP